MRMELRERSYWNGDRHYRSRTSAPKPQVKNNDAITLRYKGKKMPAKVARVIDSLVEAVANGKRYLCERHGAEFVASGML